MIFFSQICFFFYNNFDRQRLHVFTFLGLPSQAETVQRQVQVVHPHEGSHQGEAVQMRGES